MAPVIEWLYRRGYVCFWQGNKGVLAQLSGHCYQEETRNRFGFARSNAVCTYRADVLRHFRELQSAPRRPSRRTLRRGLDDGAGPWGPRKVRL